MKVASATLPGARRILDERRAATQYVSWDQRRYCPHTGHAPAP